MNIDTGKLNIEIGEVLRYMGVKKAGTGFPELEHMKTEILELYHIMIGAIRPKYLYKRVRLENNVVMGSELVFDGAAINKFLCGIEDAALMVVTLGHEYELFVKSRVHMGDSMQNLIIDALGTELVEKCADIVEREIRDSVGKGSSARFSPGYGDFGLHFQKPLLDYLEAHRIGVYCNEHYMMFPQKTVTAVVKFEEFQGGCSQCAKADCEYKK